MAQDRRRRSRPATTPALGFLHIPKTGGSGIRALGRKVVKAGQPFPCGFGTAGRSPRSASAFRDAARLHPARPARARDQRLQLAAAPGPADLHEPLAPAEAAAFAHFPESSAGSTRCSPTTTEPLGLRLRAAARHPPALELPLLLQEPAAVAEHADHIALVGRIEATDAFIDALLAEAGIPPRASPASTSAGTRRRSGPRACSPATARATSHGCARGSPTSTRSTRRCSRSRRRAGAAVAAAAAA